MILQRNLRPHQIIKLLQWEFENEISVFVIICSSSINLIKLGEYRSKWINLQKIKVCVNRRWTSDYLLSQTDGAGAGGTCQFFSFYKSVGQNTTKFDEVNAIYTSLQNLFIWLQNCQNIVILSDSKAAFQASTFIPEEAKIKET